LTSSNDVSYDEVKTHNIQFSAMDEGAFNLKILCQQKRVNNIKLANDKPTLTQY